MLMANQYNRDVHHLLWPKRKWNRGYARALRSHEWLRMKIPRDTLHNLIHQQVRVIPIPEGKDARKVYEILTRAYSNHEITQKATLEDRLDFLIRHLSTPSTVAALERQREVVRWFYSREP